MNLPPHGSIKQNHLSFSGGYLTKCLRLLPVLADYLKYKTERETCLSVENISSSRVFNLLKMETEKNIHSCFRGDAGTRRHKILLQKDITNLRRG